MQPDDFTFAFLAAAVRAAGGQVHVPASLLLSLNNGSMIEIDDDGKGGQYLTLVDRPKNPDAPPTLKRILQGEICE